MALSLFGGKALGNPLLQGEIGLDLEFLQLFFILFTLDFVNINLFLLFLVINLVF